MYGESYASPATGYFSAGENPAVLKSLAVTNLSSHKFVGAVLELMFTSPDGVKTYPHRMFPVKEAEIPAKYQEYVKNFTAKSSNNGKSPQTLEEFTRKKYEVFGGEIRAIACEYMSSTQFDDYSSRWKAKNKENGKEATFESFVGMVAAAIKVACPGFATQEGRLLLGYKPGNTYLQVPKFNVETACYFTTDPSKRLETFDFSKFQFTKPDGARPSGYEMANTTAEDTPVGATTAASTMVEDDDLPF